MFTITTAPPDERVAALRLVFRHLAEAEQAVRVDNASQLISKGELDPAGILVVRSAGRLAGALLCLPLPGAGGLLWPPQVSDGPEKKEQEDQLVTTGLAWLQSRDAKLAQAILPREEAQFADPLLRNGFTHVTRLQYLRHDLNASVANSASLAVQTYRHVDRDLFHQILLRTYEGTLDCPEVNGLRSIGEVIRGHQAQGAFDPEHWWLARDGEKPVGVLLTIANPETQSWDLSYVGVVPEARGRGWGRCLTQLAMAAAQAAAAEYLTVAVDARNQPACRLYNSLGFAITGEREVFLHFFSRAGA